MYKSYGDYNESYASSQEEIPSKKYSYDLMSSEDFHKVLPRVEVILVDAWAPWCQPCKTLSVKFEQLGDKFSSFLENKRLLLLKDNIDEEENSHHRSLVEVVPTFFVYVRGALQHVWTGVDFSQVESFLSQYFSQSNHHLPQTTATSFPMGMTSRQSPSNSIPSQIKKNIHYPPKNIG